VRAQLDRPVERAVAAAVEPVPHGLTAAGGDRAGAGQRGERGVAANPADVGERHHDLGGADRPDAGSLGQPGCELFDQLVQLASVGLQRAGGFADRDREPTNLAVPHGLQPVGLDGSAAARQGGQGGVGERGSGGVPVAIVTGQQQGPQPVDLPGAGGDHLLPGGQQYPQRLAGAVGARGGQLGGVLLQREQRCQMRVDRIGLTAAAAVLAGRLLALEHRQPGGGQRSAESDAVAAGALDCGDDVRAGWCSAIHATSRVNPAVSLATWMRTITAPVRVASSAS
jgi:hypothetical protein